MTNAVKAQRSLGEIVQGPPELDAAAPVAKRPQGRPVQHGAAMLARALAHLPVLPPSSPIVRRVRRLERALTKQLGGSRNLTVAERQLITQAAKKVVICDAMGDWIFRESSPDDGGTRLATVLIHDGCQRTLCQLLTRLGLAKRSGPRSTFD